MTTPTHQNRAAAGPRGTLGLRNVARFTSDSLGFLRTLTDRYGDFVQMRLAGKPWFLINHPDDIEAVFVRHAGIMARDEYVSILERVLGKGLLTSEGPLWKRQRKLMAKAFTPRRIRDYAASMVQVTDRALVSWETEGVRNLHEEMSRVTMEVVAEVLFGTGVEAGQVETVRRSMESINEYLANSPEAVLKLPGWFPTRRLRNTRKATAAIDELLYGIIDARRAGPPREDLLGTLIAATDDDGSRMDARQLRDEAVTLFLAGHETTALLLAHALYFLSLHPNVRHRLHREIDEVLGGRTPSAEDVKQLSFTKQVLDETMRLLPPAWTTGREATEDVVIAGNRIPKGAQILISQWVVHRDPRWFPNPEGFDPDRWSPERAKAIPRYAYFPFGGGPRVCIGNHFAMMEATLILVRIAQHYRVDLLPGQTLELRPSVTLRQRGEGLRVRLTRRPSFPERSQRETETLTPPAA